MTRKTTIPAQSSRRTRSAAPAAAPVAVPTVPATDAGTLPHPTAAILEFRFGSRGRPDSATVALQRAAFDMLSDAILAMPEPKALRAPANAPKTVRAEYDRLNAERVAALAFLRASVANGRSRTR